MNVSLFIRWWFYVCSTVSCIVKPIKQYVCQNIYKSNLSWYIQLLSLRNTLTNKKSALYYSLLDAVQGAPMEGESRNVLVESARIARGNVKPLTELSSASADAVIFPGGFGAAKNLSDFAVNGANLAVTVDVSRVIKDFHAAKKPIGLCCIAPILAAKVLGDKGVSLTLGKADDGSGKWPHADAIEAAKGQGATLVDKGVDEVHIDTANKIVTSPAFMYDGKYHEIQDGVGKMVAAVLSLLK